MKGVWGGGGGGAEDDHKHPFTTISVLHPGLKRGIS